MNMRIALLFLGGFFIGGIIVRRLIIGAERRAAHPHELDPEYEPARRALLKHLSVHGTVNLASAGRLLDITEAQAARYLDWMKYERLIKMHGHSDRGGFYTIS